MSQERLENIKTNTDAINFVVSSCPFDHPELALVALAGSHGNKTAGDQSDLDIMTVMKSQNPATLEVGPIRSLGEQLSAFCDDLHLQSDVTPIVISTIRLEEAQIQMAKLVHPGRRILPIHWLHYPSIEFMATNEPPKLAKGLLRGKAIRGDITSVRKQFEQARQQPVREISGLDWLTDSLRILIANKPTEDRSARFPLGFLVTTASHNLDYFWKWSMIVSKIERETGLEITDWADAQKLAKQIFPDLLDMQREVNRVRHLGEDANPEELINLHDLTFSVWRNLH